MVNLFVEFLCVWCICFHCVCFKNLFVGLWCADGVVFCCCLKGRLRIWWIWEFLRILKCVVRMTAFSFHHKYHIYNPNPHPYISRVHPTIHKESIDWPNPATHAPTSNMVSHQMSRHPRARTFAHRVEADTKCRTRCFRHHRQFSITCIDTAYATTTTKWRRKKVDTMRVSDVLNVPPDVSAVR